MKRIPLCAAAPFPSAAILLDNPMKTRKTVLIWLGNRATILKTEPGAFSHKHKQFWSTLL